MPVCFSCYCKLYIVLCPYHCLPITLHQGISVQKNYSILFYSILDLVEKYFRITVRK